MAAHAFPDLAPFLTGNQQWAAQTNAAQPEVLPTLAQGQAPPVLWMGCSDSRVTESVIMQRKPGDVFVHVRFGPHMDHDMSSTNTLIPL
jgi:carbonic anhydrase